MAITVAPLASGVALQDPPVTIYAEEQLFGERARQERRRRRSDRDPARIIQQLADLRPGAPVVHEDYGIGRYLGLTTMDAGGMPAEFLVLEYAEGDKLYVPVQALERISSDTGAPAETAPLHKLGGDQWSKARAKAAAKIRDAAAELLDVYSRHSTRQGHAFPLDEQQLHAFEAGFPFEESRPGSRHSAGHRRPAFAAAGFISKEMFFAETFALQSPWSWLMPVAATLGGVLSVAYSARFVHDVFFGGEAQGLTRQRHEPPRFMRVPIEILVVACLLIGLAPGVTVEPVLRLAAEEARSWVKRPVFLLGGLSGRTQQAREEAAIARGLGYHAGMLSLAAMKGASMDELIAHSEAVAAEIPLVGFYLQTAVGGIPLPAEFWRRFCAIDNVIAVKIAPFNRYRTLDVAKGLVAARAEERVTLYTGNDDHIVLDLLTPYRVRVDGRSVERRIVGGLLGHWAVWTRRAVELLERCRGAAATGPIPQDLLALAEEVTDANAAVFDASYPLSG